MLNLTRRVEEDILILCPDGQTVTVRLKAGYGVVRAILGIDAPQAYKIHRKEMVAQARQDDVDPQKK